MKPSQIFKISVILTALSGCSSQQADFGNPDWRPFKDIDGKIQEITFFTWKSIQSEGGRTIEREIPRAYLAKPFGNLKVKEELGEMYPLGKINDQSAMGTIFLLDGKSQNIYKKESVELLSKAKQFEFYEFGGMRLSHAKFSAKNGICQDFNGKNGVDLLMTTNYYPQNSFTDFYTALINVTLHRAKSPKEVGYRADFTGNNETLQAAMKAEEKKNSQKLVALNVQEKASLLFNMICK
ncbi:MAG: hypothetical protein Q4B95_02575 [Lonepinella koalarum]|nr:hypothetical protein [Lonepinella koalarum]